MTNPQVWTSDGETTKKPTIKKSKKCQKIQPILNKEFEQLLQSIKKKDKSCVQPKHTTSKVSNIQAISSPPKPHKLWCPTPKVINTQQNVWQNSKSTIKQSHDTPRININHMFTDTCRKQTLDQLLQGDDKKSGKQPFQMN